MKADPEDQRFLLRLALETAVPLWIHKYRALDKPTLEFIARKCGAVLAEKGDTLLFRCKRARATQDTFNDTARGLAAACLATGQDINDIFDKLWPTPTKDAR